MDSFGGIKIEKLGEDNFHVWKQKVELLLALKDLDDHLESTRPTDDDELSAWKKKDAKARAVIGLSISDEHLDHVRDTENAAEMWKAICDVFQRKTLLNRINARRAFYTAKMRDDEKMLHFINRVRHLASDLKSMDVVVEEEDIAMAILCGLPDRFEHLIVAIDTTIGDRKLDLEFVKSRLLQEEQRMNDRAKEESGSDTALVGAQSRKKSMVCYYCGKKGHIQRNCFKRQRDEASKEQSAAANPAVQTNLGNEKRGCDSDSDFVCLIATGSVEESISDWIIDSGATAHMTYDESMFDSYSKRESAGVSIGNDSKLESLGHGSVHLDLAVEGRKSKCRLGEVVHVPNLRYHLLSVSAMCDLGARVVFDKTKVCVYKGNTMIAQGRRIKGLYYLCTAIEVPEDMDNALVTDLSLWHARMAHVNVDGIKHMARNGVVSGLNVDLNQSMDVCDSCVVGKSTRAPTPKQGGERALHPLDLVHSDICGPIQVGSLGGSRYFVTFIDDHSRFCFLYMLKTKDEVFHVFVKWLKMVQNQSDRHVKTITARESVLHALRTDNAGEYVSKKFSQELERHGIEHQRTVPYNPHQNGLAERFNRTLMDLVRSMLHHKKLPKSFWAEALNVAVYVRNRVTCKALPSDVTPLEMWSGYEPDLSNLRVFGSRCWYKVVDHKLKKLEQRAVEAIFIGYTSGSNGYKLWDAQKKKVVVSRDVRFDECSGSDQGTDHVDDDDYAEIDISDKPKSNITSTSTKPTDAAQVEPAAPDTPPEEASGSGHDEPTAETEVEPDVPDPPPLRRSTRERRAPTSWWRGTALLTASDDVPSSYSDAVSRPDSKAWTKAMNSEYESLMEHDTWELVPRPADSNVISSKWVFVQKYEAGDNDEPTVRYKARVVARGFLQIEGVDFSETYAPVVKFTSIRMILSIVAVQDYHLHQMDVKTAFLNGDLEETVYMEQPDGFIKPGNEDLVCLLKKAIYGLRQASRQWFAKMYLFLVGWMGLKPNVADECVYTGEVLGALVIIALYVDDLLIASPSMETMNRVKRELSKRFQMKDLSEARMVLGFEIHRDRSKRQLYLTQSAYTRKVLERFGMLQCKPMDTPMDSGADLTKVEEPLTNIPYRQVIGCLMYLSVGTRPDISFAVSKLAKYVEKPGETHWKAVKRVLRYLNGTRSLGLTYGTTTDTQLYGYVDSDWAGDTSNRKSTSGYVFMMCGAPVSWSSRQQEVVALSSAEAEYVSLCSGTKEAIWLRRLWSGIGNASGLHVDESVTLMVEPTTVYVDNQGCIDLARNGVVNKRTKHIDIRFHFTREALRDKAVQLQYCSTEDMVADMLTKALGRVKLARFRGDCGLLPLDL